ANRLPAPTLFVGPPSRNASQLSVSRQGIEQKATRDPLLRQKSALAKDPDPKDFPRLKKQSEREVDARWRELQSTLNEVELTAQSSTHVFGASHAAALDQLRKAQVELARAWGRDAEVMGRYSGAQDLINDRTKTTRTRAGTNASVSTVESGESTAQKKGPEKLEDETAQDIKLASERRAANEAYFKKVDEGVKDVVAKLEVVAEAMKGVEGESRSLWSGS
ncbi:hypothetical protein BAUCODRAFT_54641, partial [Baudoinia panamericana UAMH 10762]